MKLKIGIFIILFIGFYSCKSLKSNNKNDVLKPTEIAKNDKISINKVAEEVKIEETVSHNSLRTSTVMLTQQQQFGKDLFQNKCSNCHTLYNAKDFSAEEWKPILLRMQLQAEISDNDRENIYAYVTMQ